MTITLDQIWPVAAVIAFVFVGIAFMRRWIREANAGAAKSRAAMNERMEALFRASFPELQPHFHPARVLEYVRARRARVPSGASTTWRKPPGFPAAEEAQLVLEGMKDNVRLVDAGGAQVAKFVYEEHPEGGVIRFGKGKFTVNLKGAEPRVRYWHPEREFKWTPTSWNLKSGVADQELASRSRDDDSWSDSSSSSSSSTSSTARTTAAGAGIVAAGGTFDGGGASAAWDDGGSSGSSTDSAPDFSTVESGSSSSSSSTSY